MYETNRLVLKKAEFPDWEQMYRNVWRHAQSARYMLWSVTADEEAARERMRRTIAFQREHSAWTVYEKASGQAVGFAGFLQLENGVCEDTGICLGPEFVGRGYGRELLNALVRISREDYGAREFLVTCRRENAPSRGMILGCGFRFSHCEEKIDPRDGAPYTLEFYRKQCSGDRTQSSAGG